MKTKLLVAALGIALAGAPSDASAAAPQVRTFLGEAMKGDNSEVNLGSLAARRGSSGQVRDFGHMLVTDHGKAKVEVGALARQMRVPVTDRIAPEAAAERAKLLRLHGTSFDREFARYMVEDHKKDIGKFEAEAKSRDPDAVTSLARRTLPTLRKHLAVAERLVTQR